MIKDYDINNINSLRISLNIPHNFFNNYIYYIEQRNNNQSLIIYH